MKIAGYSGSGPVFAVSRNGKPAELQAALACSPDRRTLAYVAAGRLLGMGARRLSLRTRLESGVVIESADPMQMPDLSGSWEPDFLYNADVAEVVAFHDLRLEGRGPALPFDEGKLLQECEQLNVSRARRLEQLGLATVHPGGDTWSFTWRGAIGLQGAWKRQHARAFAQADRYGRPRPGDSVATE